MSPNDTMITPPVAFPKQELTLNEAFNVLRARVDALKGSKVRDWATGQLKNSPISVAPFADRVRFLTYAISLCEGQPKYVALLRIRLFMAGHPVLTTYTKKEGNRFLAMQLTAVMKRLIRPEQIETLEKEAIDFVQQEIRRTKATMLPLVGAA